MTNRAAPTVLVDADNTLWNTDAVYSAAQLNLLSEIERQLQTRPIEGDRLAYVRLIDQGIAERHHSKLRYPPRLLMQGLARAVRGETFAEAVRHALAGEVHFSGSDFDVAERNFVRDLDAIPELRVGVEEGLVALRAGGTGVIVVTEGGRDRVIATAAHLRIDRYVDRFIDGPKQPELFRRLRQLSAVTSAALMVGDQLDRDIIPAKSVGLATVYFPGDFRPRWAPDPDNVRPDFVIQSFLEVPGIVTTLAEEPRARAL